jgi:hypothetical protein
MRAVAVSSRIRFLLLLLGVACARPLPPPRPPAAEPAAPAGPPVYYLLRMEGSGVMAQALLNDVPIESIEPIDRATATTRVNIWIRPGPNRLRLRGTLPSAGRKRLPAGAAVRVVRRETLGEVAPDDVGQVVLASLVWRPERGAATFDLTRDFQPDPPPPSGLWQRADPVNLDQQVVGQSTELALELVRALSSRNLERATELLDFKTVDVARSDFVSPEKARTNQRQFLEHLMDDQEFAVDPIDPRTLTFELCADSRLIRITRSSRPPIQARLSQGGRFLLGIYAAKVGGVWRIAR